jgi:hypothetical protein
MPYDNRRYVLGFRFSDPGETSDEFSFTAQTKAITVTEPFLLASISVVVRCSGQYTAFGYPSTYMNISLNSLGFSGTYWFDFLWKMSDTSRQREWTRGWQPSAFLHSSVVGGPMDLPKRNPLPSGTELKMQIMPIQALRSISDESDVTMSSYEVEVSFSGVENAC